MTDALLNHTPSEVVRKRAEAAGLDLEALRHDDPTAYAMLNAQHLLRVSPPLLGVAGEVLFAGLPDHQAFDLPPDESGTLGLLVFPPLNGEALEELDNAFEKTIQRPELREVFAYYRVVGDLKGTRREFGLPTPPDAWRAPLSVMVGPFEKEAEAKEWGVTRIPEGFLFDVLPYGGRWFCDVFLRRNALGSPGRAVGE